MSENEGEKKIKMFLGVAALSAIALWMLTTKNEVVESLIFPLKVKLGIAKYSNDSGTMEWQDIECADADAALKIKNKNTAKNTAEEGTTVSNRDSSINDFPIYNNSGTVNITNPTITHNHTHHHTHTHTHTNSTDFDQPKTELDVSQPYIYEVASFGNHTINMFGAELNLGERNLGNPPVTSFNYDLNGWFGGGYAGYYALLQRTLSTPFSVGRIRMESPFSSQLMQPILITEQNPSGRQKQKAGVQYLKLNQYFPGAVERQCNITIYGGTQLSYLQIADPTNPSNQTSVKWYFWPANIVSLTRFLEGNPMIKRQRSPDTLLTPKVSINKMRREMELNSSLN